MSCSGGESLPAGNPPVLFADVPGDTTAPQIADEDVSAFTSTGNSNSARSAEDDYFEQLDLIAGGDSAASVSKLGHIVLQDHGNYGMADNSVRLIGSFYQYSQPFNAQRINNLFYEADSCSLLNTLELPLFDQMVNLKSYLADTITAGEYIALNASGTLYAQPLTASIGDQVGVAGLELPMPVPETLSIEIPGDEFPAFSVGELTRAHPVTGLTLRTQYSSTGELESVDLTWDSDERPRSAITLTGGLSTSQVSEEGTDWKLFDCIVRDDGAFSLPQSTIDRIKDYVVGDFVGARRLTALVEYSENAVFVFGSQSDSAFFKFESRPGSEMVLERGAFKY